MLYTQIKQKIRHIILSTAGALILWLLFLSLRKRVVGIEQLQALIETKKPLIFTFWHGRQLMMGELYHWLKRPGWPPLCVLISAHRDGRLIAQAMKLRKIESVQGSSTRGGLGGFLNLFRKIEEGYAAGITPDGPRGPIYKVKNGVIHLAQLSNAVIFPAAYSAKQKWCFNSWDQMILPKPFSLAVVRIGTPLIIQHNSTDQEQAELSLRLEKELNTLTKWCDEYEYNDAVV